MCRVNLDRIDDWLVGSRVRRTLPEVPNAGPSGAWTQAQLPGTLAAPRG